MKQAIVSVAIIIVTLVACGGPSDENAPATSKFQSLTECGNIPNPTWGDLRASSSTAFDHGDANACWFDLQTPDAHWWASCDQASETCACSYHANSDSNPAPTTCTCHQVPQPPPLETGCPHTCCPGVAVK